MKDKLFLQGEGGSYWNYLAETYKINKKHTYVMLQFLCLLEYVLWFLFFKVQLFSYFFSKTKRQNPLSL